MTHRDALRICVFADTFPKLSETFVRDQVIGLRSAGVDVTVVTDRLSTPLDDTDDLVAQRRWGALSLIEPRLRHLPAAVSDRAITGLDRIFARRLCGFDAVIAHFGMNGVRVARTGRRTSGFPPLVTIFHGFDVGMAAHDGTLDQYRPLFDFPGLLLTVNKPFRDMLVAAGAPPERTRVHHLGIRSEAIPFRRRAWSGPIRFLSVCRLTEKKGIAQALKALARLRATAPGEDWRYTIIGEGELREELVAQADASGLSDRVEFRGAVPHEQVRAALDAADVFLLPSLTAASGDMEGIPIVLMEAMAAGLLVVSSDHSGIPELIADGETGLLAREGDVDDLHRRLVWMMEHRDRLNGLAEAALASVRTTFHADRQSRELVGWLHELRGVHRAGEARAVAGTG